MADQQFPMAESRRRRPPSPMSTSLWITAGLGCDGDSVSITAATQPSIEDVVLGAIPGLPKVHLHNPVLAYEVGDDFLKFWYQAERGQARAVRARRRRLDPEREDQEAKDTGPRSAPTRRPASRSRPDEWIDRLAPKALAVVAIGTCATYGGIHAMAGNPTGCMGLADYLGWDWQIEGRAADRQRARAARCSRTTSWRRCSTCCTRSPAWRR